MHCFLSLTNTMVDSTKLLSGLTVVFAPALPPAPPVRTVSSFSFRSALLTPPSSKMCSFPARSLTDREPAPSALRRGLALKCGAAAGIAEIDETQFADVVLSSDRPVLVEFVANWCGPCRLISPAIQWVAREYKERLMVVKIDHDANPELIKEYKVYGLPALIVFKNGKEVPESRREGAITKVKLKEYVDAVLDSIAAA